MRREHRHDERVIQQLRDLVGADAALAEAGEGVGDIFARFVQATLPVFGQIGEHREQHEGAHECERVVGVQRFEPATGGGGVGDAAIPIHGARADALDLLEQPVAAVSADDIAQQFAEITDVGVLGDRPGRRCVRRCGGGIHAIGLHDFVGRSVRRLSDACKTGRCRGRCFHPYGIRDLVILSRSSGRSSGGGHAECRWIMGRRVVHRCRARWRIRLQSRFSFGCGRRGRFTPPPVKVVRVQARDLPLYRDFVGQTRGKQDVEVRARVQGYLQTINFRQGGDVKSGDLLFTIDRRPYQAALAQAKAAEAQLRSQYQQAQSDAERYAQLTKTGVISKQQAEQTASQAKAAGAALDAQLAVVNAKQVDLTYTEIRAPISGRIGLTPYSVGDLVGTATGTEKPLATISELDSVLVRFAISETDYLRYLQDHPDAAKNVDQPRTITDLRLTLADGSVYPHPGMITRADNVIDSASGTLTVEAQFPNPERTLRAGQYAKIRVGSRVLKNAIAVPARAVQEQQGIASVRVVGDDNHVESREVQIADRSSDFWALASGLKPR